MSKFIKNVVLLICTAYLVLVISGCSRILDMNFGLELPAAEQAQALKDEKSKQYLWALRYWENTEAQVSDKISSLTEIVLKTSEEHSQKGVIFFEEKKGTDALWEFMEALRYNPSNKVALEYLKKRYKPDRFILYTVVEKDSFEKIAEKIYGVFFDSFLIKHFSEVSSEDELTPGSVLTLPVPDSFYSQALFDYNKDINAARRLYKSLRYEELLPLAEDILTRHPGDKESSYLVNMSLLRIGEKLQKRGQYEEAANIFSRVDPSFKNVTKKIATIRQLQQELRKKEALQVNTLLFLEGEQLYAQGKYLEALEIFIKIDPNFEEIETAVSNVKARLNEQAEIHYKEGVTLFVEENLAGAIAAWEKTLQLDPNHPKALNSVIQARKLLEKFEEIN